MGPGATSTVSSRVVSVGWWSFGERVNDTDKYILDAIKTWVWSGFYGPSQVDKMIDDILEDGVDEQLLRDAVGAEFEKKRVSEGAWPAVTDCDRLDKAFNRLNQGGVIALQNAGFTMSDGLEDVSEVLQTRGRNGVAGYCFYHGQDLEGAVAGRGLMLAFGNFEGDSDQAVKVGHTICAAIKDSGLEVEWKGDPKTRIAVTSLDWKRRGARATMPRPWWRFW